MSRSVIQSDLTTRLNTYRTLPVGTIVGTTDTQNLENKQLIDSTTFLYNSADPTRRVRLNLANIGTGVDAIWTFPSGTGATFTATSATQTLTNKSLQDATTFIIDDGFPTKRFQFQLSGVTTGATRVATIPDRDGTMVVASADMPITLTAPAVGDVLEYSGTAWLNGKLPKFSSILFLNTATPTQIAIVTQSVYVLVNPTTALNSISNGAFDTPSSGRLRFIGTGTHNCVVSAEISGNFTTSNRSSSFLIYRDGVALANSETIDTYHNAGSYQSTHLRFISTCTTNTFFEVYIANISNNSPFDCIKLRLELQLLNRTA